MTEIIQHIVIENKNVSLSIVSDSGKVFSEKIKDLDPLQKQVFEALITLCDGKITPPFMFIVYLKETNTFYVQQTEGEEPTLYVPDLVDEEKTIIDSALAEADILIN